MESALGTERARLGAKRRSGQALRGCCGQGVCGLGLRIFETRRGLRIFSAKLAAPELVSILDSPGDRGFRGGRPSRHNQDRPHNSLD